MGSQPAPKNVEGLQRAVRQLQAQLAGLAGGAPASGLFNGVLAGAPKNSVTRDGVTSMLWLEPNAATGKAGGVTVKRTESTWGVSAGSPAYGDAQPFEVLSPSTQDASDTSDDGTGSGGQNPVLMRVDAFGGIGTVQGVHISPGLRDTYGGGTPIGLWVQAINLDTYGVIASGPDPAKVPTPFAPLFQAQTYDAKKRWNVDASGDMNSYGDDGTTGMASIAAGDVPGFGHRVIARAGDPAVRVMGLRREVAQTAAFIAFLDHDGTTPLSAVDAEGDFVTFADDGLTGVGAMYAGTTPVVGFRALLATQSAATVGLGLKSVGSQTADLLATYDHTGAKIATIIDHTGNLAGGAVGTPLTLSASSGFLLIGEDAGTPRMAVDYLGDILTYEDDGVTAAVNITGGTTPGAGYRISLLTGAAGTVGLGIRLHSGQTADAIQVIDGSGTTRTIVDANGTIEPAISALGGQLVPSPPLTLGQMLYADGTGGTFWSSAPSGGGLTSFNGRTTAAATLMASDITALGGSLVPPGGAAGKVLTKLSATDFDVVWA